MRLGQLNALTSYVHPRLGFRRLHFVTLLGPVFFVVLQVPSYGTLVPAVRRTHVKVAFGLTCPLVSTRRTARTLHVSAAMLFPRRNKNNLRLPGRNEIQTLVHRQRRVRRVLVLVSPPPLPVLVVLLCSIPHPEDLNPKTVCHAAPGKARGLRFHSPVPVVVARWLP